MKPRITPFSPSHLSAVLALFHHTVHTVNQADYSEDQLNVWAPQMPDEDRWRSRLSLQFTCLCFHNDQLAGFASLGKEGYIDLLYVAANQQGNGVGSLLLNELEVEILRRGEDRAYTYASITAYPFFLHKGYALVRENEVIREGITLKNFLLEKRIRNSKG